MKKTTKRAYNRKTELETFKLEQGVPMGRSRVSEEDQRKLRNTLTKLDKVHHFVVPVKMIGALKRIASSDFPEYQVRVSINREKKTASVWRIK